MSRRRHPSRVSSKAHLDQVAQWDKLHHEVKRWTGILDEVQASIDRYDATKAAYEAACEAVRKEREDPTSTSCRVLPDRAGSPE